MDWLDVSAAAVFMVVPFILGGVSFYLIFNRPKPGAPPLELLVYDLATLAVEAAQQIYKDAEPQAKKLYAFGVLEKALPKVDPAIIDAAIEAAVYRLKSDK